MVHPRYPRGNAVQNIIIGPEQPQPEAASRNECNAHVFERRPGQHHFNGITFRAEPRPMRPPSRGGPAIVKVAVKTRRIIMYRTIRRGFYAMI